MSTKEQYSEHYPRIIIIWPGKVEVVLDLTEITENGTEMSLSGYIIKQTKLTDESSN